MYHKKTDLVDSDRQDLFLTDRYFVIFRLNNTLSVHSIYNFFEACDVSTCYIVAFSCRNVLAASSMLWQILTMIPCSFASTSSNVQLRRSLFWVISRADVATPPAFAALPGAKITPFFCRYSVASSSSRHISTFAYSDTAVCYQLLLHRRSAVHSELHMEEQHHILRSIRRVPHDIQHLVCSSVYSVSLARFTSLISLSAATSIPSGSYIQPVESRACNHFCAQLLCFLDCIDSNVAGTGYSNSLASQYRCPFSFSSSSCQV